MKRLVILSFCLLAAAAASGQTITSGTRWFNGSDQYDATVRPDGSIFMYSMDEGQESEFLLKTIFSRLIAFLRPFLFSRECLLP